MLYHIVYISNSPMALIQSMHKCILGFSLTELALNILDDNSYISLQLQLVDTQSHRAQFLIGSLSLSIFRILIFDILIVINPLPFYLEIRQFVSRLPDLSPCHVTSSLYILTVWFELDTH